ncbi:MAG TPA: UDP-glucose 4-epimerase GalE [Alphaproteobacteria bacterium]|nr:UDP-glucose 4-epimerase GalE [Alphaproteobacteria bacterium]
MAASKTVLVTGGAGYVGAHASKALYRAGYMPVVYDNLVYGHREAVKWGPLVEGDVHDAARLADTLAAHKPSAVMHFAAYAYVGESVENPLKYYNNNVGGTLSLLGAMRDAGIDKLVFSSTCATYGVPETPLLAESHPQKPINPYGESKWMIERVLAGLAAAGQMNYVALRYFNAAGADPDGEIGEDHDPETHLIPRAIAAAHGGPALKIFGDFPTPDGTAIRDYIHVNDLATAHVKALEHLVAGKSSDVFNLGTGHGHSVREVVDALRALGLDPKTEKAPRRAGDPPQLVADATKAGAVFGWKPAMSDLATILKTAVAWHEKKGNFR